MNIMIFDVPAINRGALTLLEEFHHEVLVSKNESINWLFVLSEPKLKETKNITVLRYPWVKKSWFHRLYFDHFLANKLIKQHQIDRVISFQNVIVPHTKVPQTLYVHQSLPFSEYKFKFRENKLFWIYQNIIGKMIKQSIVKAESVIVQTRWMMEECIRQTGIDSKKIEIISPGVNTEIKDYFIPNKMSLKTFFYPANSMSYKNHKIIVEASKKLVENDIKDFKVIFTLTGDENENIINLHKQTKNNMLPIEFVGNISRERVFELYTKSILIFPSYIETYGLPMLESRLHKGIVFASNCLFSNEILEEYENAYFFDPFNAEELFELMKEMLLSKVSYKEVIKNPYNNKNNGWSKLFNKLN